MLFRSNASQIHPIPTFDNLTALAEVVQRMEEVGIYLMYDMRWYAFGTPLYAIVLILSTGHT